MSLRSPDVRDALQPQDGLYSVTERDTAGERLRVIGSVREVLVGGEDAERIIAALASPHVHIATFTVTEKGYLRDPEKGSLLTTATDLAHDLQGIAAPRTIYGFLERGLVRRRAAGLPGMTLMSCDNLAGNGRKLAALLDEYLERRDPMLAQWARRENSYPCTMVDRIVPATAAADLRVPQACSGFEDRAAVVTERFSQWVIEDPSPVRARSGKRAAPNSPLTYVHSRRPSCGCSTAHTPRSRTSDSAWGSSTCIRRSRIPT